MSKGGSGGRGRGLASASARHAQSQGSRSIRLSARGQPRPPGDLYRQFAQRRKENRAQTPNEFIAHTLGDSTDAVSFAQGTDRARYSPPRGQRRGGGRRRAGGRRTERRNNPIGLRIPRCARPLF